MNKEGYGSVKKAKIAYIAYSAVIIALGIMLIMVSSDFAEVMTRVTGGILLCCGIVKFITYFVNDAYGLAFQFDFAMGIFTVIMGLLLLFHPRDVLSIANIMIGLFVIVDGAFKTQTAKEAKSFGMNYWWVILIFSLLTTIAGLLLVFNPLKAVVAMTVICGAAMVIDGLENLFIALYTLRLVKRFHNVD